MKLGPRASARWPWMLLPIVVCGLLLAWIARRSPVPRERGARAVPRPPPGVSVGTKTARSPDRHDIGGRVVDVGDDAPVPSAVVRVSLADGTNREATVDADGRFQLRDLPHGEGQLLVRASGYRELTHTVVLPHRGEWSEVVVRLDSLRAYALAAFRRAVLERLPSHEVWPVRTNRELVEQASSRDPRSDQTLGTLERRVEVAYYAPEPPGPADIHAIEALAEDVHRPSTSGPLSEKPPE